MEQVENLNQFFDLIKDSQEGFLIFVPKDGMSKPVVYGKKTEESFCLKTFFNLSTVEYEALLDLFRALEDRYDLTQESNDKIPEFVLKIINSFTDSKESKIYQLSSFKQKAK